MATTTESFSIANGKIYGKTSGVSATGDDEIAEFLGKLTLEIVFTGVERGEQERFAKDSYYGQGRAIITVRDLKFKPAIFNLIWSITYNAADTLNDGATSATSYTVKQSSKPQSIEILFQCTSTGDGLKIEIEAKKVICPGLIIPFDKQLITMEDLTFICFADSNEDIVAVRKENAA